MIRIPRRNSIRRGAALTLLLLLLLPSIALAQDTGDRFGLSGAVAGTGIVQKSAPEVIGQIIFNVLSIVGVVFLVLIIYGGIQWMTSGGNEKRIELAKKILTTSVIGLVIIMTAYSVTYFIVENLSGAAIDRTTGACSPTDPNCPPG